MMEKLAKREEDILNFIVRDYIRSAVPISSNRVCDVSKVNLSPATIRNSMLELDEHGYLKKPHSSAGRVPTDKSYRYFVDHLMHDGSREAFEDAFGEIIRAFLRKRELRLEEFTKALSSELGLFCASANLDERGRVMGFGFSETMDEPEFSDHEMSLEFAKLVDNLENLAGRFFEASQEENPSSEAKSFSSVTLKFNNVKLGHSIVFSIGPKRMNYERAFSLLEGVARDLFGESEYG
jgi:transcriptional regulator of heat shock response